MGRLYPAKKKTSFLNVVKFPETVMLLSAFKYSPEQTHHPQTDGVAT